MGKNGSHFKAWKPEMFECLIIFNDFLGSFGVHNIYTHLLYDTRPNICLKILKHQK